LEGKAWIEQEGEHARWWHIYMSNTCLLNFQCPKDTSKLKHLIIRSIKFKHCIFITLNIMIQWLTCKENRICKVDILCKMQFGNHLDPQGPSTWGGNMKWKQGKTKCKKKKNHAQLKDVTFFHLTLSFIKIFSTIVFMAYKPLKITYGD